MTMKVKKTGASKEDARQAKTPEPTREPSKRKAAGSAKSKLKTSQSEDSGLSSVECTPVKRPPAKKISIDSPKVNGTFEINDCNSPEKSSMKTPKRKGGQVNVEIKLSSRISTGKTRAPIKSASKVWARKVSRASMQDFANDKRASTNSSRLKTPEKSSKTPEKPQLKQTKISEVVSKSGSKRKIDEISNEENENATPSVSPRKSSRKSVLTPAANGNNKISKNETPKKLSAIKATNATPMKTGKISPQKKNVSTPPGKKRLRGNSNKSAIEPGTPSNRTRSKLHYKAK